MITVHHRNVAIAHAARSMWLLVAALLGSVLTMGPALPPPDGASAVAFAPVADATSHPPASATPRSSSAAQSVQTGTADATPTGTDRHVAIGLAPTLSLQELAPPLPVLRATASPAPTVEPTPRPTRTATPQPKPKATRDITPKPTVKPASAPTAKATPRPTPEPTAKPAATTKPTPKPAATPKPTPTASPKPTPTASPKPTPTPTPSPVTYSGTKRLWYPALGIDAGWRWYGCEYGGSADGLGKGVYRWGCGPANNIYLMSHAWSTFKAIQQGYHSGALKVGQKVWYANEQSKVSKWQVKWIKRVTLEYFNATVHDWALNDSPTPIMTFQTCDGKDNEYRIIVRLVPAP